MFFLIISDHFLSSALEDSGNTSVQNWAQCRLMTSWILKTSPWILFLDNLQLICVFVR